VPSPILPVETWVRWYLSSHVTHDFTVVSDPWEPLDFYPSLSSCQETVAATKKNFLEGLQPLPAAEPTVTSDSGHDVVITAKSSRIGHHDQLWILRYRCLPASIDPRKS
jgi:hypothetical protein